MSKIRLGRVEVSKEILKQYPNFLEEHMSEFDIQFITDKDEYHDIYYGTHPEFEEINTKTESTPFYMFYFFRDKDGVIHKHSVSKDLLNDED